MEQTTLRALTVSEVLDRALRIYRANFLSLVGIVAVIFIPNGILKLINVLYIMDVRIIDLIFPLIFQNIAVVALIMAISNANLGKPFTIFSAFIFGMKKFMSVIGSNVIVGFAIALPAVLFVLCLSLAETGYVAIILALPTAIFLGTRWSLKSSIIVIENVGAAAGLSRSWDLTKDFFWRVFGTSFAATLLALLLLMLPDLFTATILQLMDASSRVFEIVDVVVQQISLIIVTPFTVAVQVLIYYDLCIRKEGFDLMLRAEEK